MFTILSISTKLSGTSSKPENLITMECNPGFGASIGFSVSEKFPLASVITEPICLSCVKPPLFMVVISFTGIINKSSG